VPDQEYRERSHEIWEEVAESWDRERQLLWSVSRRVGERLVDVLDPQPGEKLLELAAGTGETGLRAAARLGDDGRLVSTDFSENMVEATRREAERLGFKNVDAQVADAERLGFVDDQFDGVLCRWGYMLMADPEAALRETRRVLRAGGRLSFAVWAGAEQNPWAAIPGRALIEQTGAPPPDPEAPGIFSMADPKRTRGLLKEAGFRSKQEDAVELNWHFDDADDYWHFLTQVAGPIAILITALSDEDRAALRERIDPAIEPFRADSGYDLPGASYVFLAD
jgi:ubiquinone/menaquinone biosynthesis C-methylase UbiE